MRAQLSLTLLVSSIFTNTAVAVPSVAPAPIGFYFSRSAIPQSADVNYRAYVTSLLDGSRIGGFARASGAPIPSIVPVLMDPIEWAMSRSHHLIVRSYELEKNDDRVVVLRWGHPDGVSNSVMLGCPDDEEFSGEVPLGDEIAIQFESSDLARNFVRLLTRKSGETPSILISALDNLSLNDRACESAANNPRFPARSVVVHSPAWPSAKSLADYVDSE